MILCVNVVALCVREFIWFVVAMFYSFFCLFKSVMPSFFAYLTASSIVISLCFGTLGLECFGVLTEKPDNFV